VEVDCCQGLGTFPRIIVYPLINSPYFISTQTISPWTIFPKAHFLNVSPKLNFLEYSSSESRFPEYHSPELWFLESHFPESHFPESRFPKSHEFLVQFFDLVRFPLLLFPRGATAFLSNFEQLLFLSNFKQL
jgi:hypothetical protein